MRSNIPIQTLSLILLPVDEGICNIITQDLIIWEPTETSAVMVLQIQNESTPLVGTIPTANPLLQRSSQRQHVVHSPLPGDSDDISCAGQPLLQRDQHQYDHPSAGAAPTLAPGVFTRHALITLIILGTILFVLEAGNYISMAPQRAIFEQIVCDGYYVAFNGGKKRAADLSVLRGGGPDAIDERCKIEPVQSEVAFVSEWLDTFQMIPGKVVLSCLHGLCHGKFQNTDPVS